MIVPPNAIVSVAASPKVTEPPLNVVVPVTVKFPATVAFAPAIVNAVVADELDLITNSPELFVNLPNSVPSSFKTISAPPASCVISPAESNVIVEASISAIIGVVKVLFVKVSEPVNEAKLSLCNAVLNSANEPVKVLVPKSSDLFVNVSVVALTTKVSVAFG